MPSTDSADGDAARTWSTWREALGVATHREHLRRAALTAIPVGTVLFAINQLDVVLSGAATFRVWVKVALTYVVPFAVTLVGVLIGSHRK